MWVDHIPYVGLEPVGEYHKVCDTWPVHRQTTVTFPASEHHCPLTGTKLYCLVTEAHRCK